MDDDTAPRMTPPPKPTVFQLSTPKPEVPEVSLMFDSDDSLIWQVSKQRNVKEKEQSIEYYAKQDKIQFSNHGRMAISSQTRDIKHTTGKEDYTNSTIRRPHIASVPHTQLLRVEKQSTIDVTSEMKQTERRLQDLQTDKPCDITDPPITHTGSIGCVNERLYNPKVYSPAQEKITKKVSTEYNSLAMRQKDSPPCVTSGAQQHAAQSEKNIFPQAKPASPLVFNSGPKTPPVMKTVMFSQDHIFTSNVNPESDNAKKTNAFHVDSCSPQIQNQNKKENIHESFPAHRQLQIPMDSQAYASGNASKHYFPPTNVSHPSQASQSHFTLQDQIYNGPVKQGVVYPEPYNYSPHNFSERLYSPPDPMVYRLIEDQNQQILKLTKTIERIVEKQQEDQSLKNVSLKESANSKVVQSMERDKDHDNLHKDISTQTLATSLPEKQCVGVNTDLSWPDLIASIRKCDTCEVCGHCSFNSAERTKVTEEIKSNDMNRNSPREDTEPEKCQRKQISCLDRRNSPFQGILPESPRQERVSMTEEGVMLGTPEERPRSQPSHPINMPQYYGSRAQEILVGHLRNDSKRTVDLGSSLALGASASTYRNHVQNQNQPTIPTSPQPGVTFYNDVLTNVQQILNSSKTSQKEKEPKKLDENEKQSTKLGEASKEIIPDPRIDAVKKQLLQFGISFIDPTSLASDHSTMLDNVYLPGVHNMLSLYQSTVSTHYQEIDGTAAKYLTDSQLAAIAAMSPAMPKRSRGVGAITSHDYPIPAEDIINQERTTQSQLYKFTVNNNFSIATKKFLDRYGLQDD